MTPIQQRFKAHEKTCTEKVESLKINYHFFNSIFLCQFYIYNKYILLGL